ncbi:hypothetical protein H2199_004953 [Coniosporium tulheliwenetii]|uniref:Uncharacterized protein n=1 Tax=Coniosporium tulheliwenetii TaxID=3383036 RepID=A0ACC2Z5R1_9PEZI|nr:hypothetical protein H2199_004953 [Cladosporium sp. JES 115]
MPLRIMKLQGNLLHSYSPAELVRYIWESPVCEKYNASVRALSANLLSKRYTKRDELEDTLKAMEVARQLGIRVPGIRRTFEFEHDTWCIMERIHGSTFGEAWPQLSWIATMKVALQLRQYIRLLRSVTSPTAGSLATGKCRSFYLEDRCELPARSSPEAITRFLKFWTNWLSFKYEISKWKPDAPQEAGHTLKWIPPTAETFVLTHHDLAPRNLLLDPDGRLWILDWDYAGFYPSYFEFAAMQNFRAWNRWSLLDRMRWDLFSWMTVGRSERERHLLEEIKYFAHV